MSNASSDAWPEEVSFAQPPPPPGASRPVPTAPHPVCTTPAARFSPAATAPPPSRSNVPTYPSDYSKIGPTSAAHTPIKLRPKKLVNPQQQDIYGREEGAQGDRGASLWGANSVSGCGWRAGRASHVVARPAEKHGRRARISGRRCILQPPAHHPTRLRLPHLPLRIDPQEHPL